MNALALNICDITINNFDGLYSLNSLHEASGKQKKHQPAFFMRNKETQELAKEIERSSNLQNGNRVKAFTRIKGGKSKEQGTYVCKELVYRYAMWISAKFALIVIRAFDNLVNPKTTADQRTPLRKACDSLAVGNMLVSEAYKLVAKQFDCDSIEQIPSHRLAEAVAFTYETKLRLQKTEPTQNINQEKLYDILADTIDMGMDYLRLVNNINVAMSSDNDYTLREIAGRVKNAINFSKESNLTNRRNQPLFDCGELNFSYGNKIIYTPKNMQMLAYYAR